MAEKLAINRVVMGQDGRLRVILIDLQTLQPVEDPSQYRVLTANVGVEQVANIDEPDPQPIAPPLPPEKAPPIVPGTPVNPQTPTFSGSIADGGRGVERGAQARPGMTTTPTPNRGPGQARPGTVDLGNSMALGPSTASSNVNTNTSIRETNSNSPSRSTTTNSPTGFHSGVGLIDNVTGTDKHRDNMPSSGFLASVQESVGKTFGPGYSVAVESGQGQYGSHRHRDEAGVAADFDVIDPQGQKVTDTNQLNDLAAQYAFDNQDAGIGFGQGYMSQGRMHLDLANDPAAWGAHGKGANMSPALKETITAARAGFQPTPFSAAPTPFGPEDKQSPATATGDFKTNPDRVKDDDIGYQAPSGGLSGVAASSVDAMGRQKAGTVGLESLSNKSVTGRPGVTTIDDGYTSIDRAGDRNARNNNPGNIRAGGFANAFGAIGADRKDDGFAVFDDMETGKAAMAGLLFTGKNYKDLSIAKAIERYAPPEENNTKGYISAITKALGLPGTTPMSSLTPDQRGQMVNAMTEVEGRLGSVRETRNQHTYSGPPNTRDRDAPSEKGGRFGGSGLGERGPSHSQERERDTSGRGGFSGRGGQDSPSESGGRFGGSGLGGNSNRGGVSNHSAERERDTSASGRSGSSGKGAASGGGTRSTDRDKDHASGGRMTD